MRDVKSELKTAPNWVKQCYAWLIQLAYGELPQQEYIYIAVAVGAFLLACCCGCISYALSRPSRKHRHKSRFGGRRAAAPRRPAGGRAGPARRRRPGGGFEDDEASAYSEDAPLFGGRKGKHGSASDTDNIDDETLLKTFKNVLKDGIQVIQHLAKGRPQQVRLFMESDNVVRWEGGKALGARRELPMDDVMFVEVGKNTATFARASVADDVCFSLVTSDDAATLDLEASSKMEREAISQGFSMILAAIKGSDEMSV